MSAAAQMQSGAQPGAQAGPRHRVSQWADHAAFLLLVLILAWAPFPLGSNRPWSWSLLAILVAMCWTLWSLGRILSATSFDWPWRSLWPALFLFAVTLLWATLQMAPVVPGSWGHPVWMIASETIGQPMAPRISIEPWRTATEIMKLSTYLAAGALSFALCRDVRRAAWLMGALIAIIALYAAYGAVMPLIQVSQNQFFYANWGFRHAISGPFVLHNSYATFLGLGLVLACVRLYPSASRSIVTTRGVRQHILSAIQYLAGKGVLGLLAIMVIFSVLVATGSRAGFLAGMMGLAAVLLCGIFLAERRHTSRWAVAGVSALFALSFGLLALGSNRLDTGFYELVEAGGLDSVRAAFWDAAARMIADAPLLGFGLGTFERVYPFYGDRMLPFVMDKAHNDYLEFAVGLGLPAAIAWWAALDWCVFLCARALFIRRRNRIYPVAALGATAVVAFHSAFDFSLQIPAVALTYAVILGLGVAQAFPTRS